jgi:hypothetical protein
MAADAPDQADSRARPRRRRVLITARPARVRIRCRNPCFFFRFRLFGWKVRFTPGLLEEVRPLVGVVRALVAGAGPIGAQVGAGF